MASQIAYKHGLIKKRNLPLFTFEPRIPRPIPLPADKVHWESYDSRYLTCFSKKLEIYGFPLINSMSEVNENFGKYGRIRTMYFSKKYYQRYTRVLTLIFESEDSIHRLLKDCSKYFDFIMFSYRTKLNYYPVIQVDVRPWVLGESDYFTGNKELLNPSLTVFVNGLSNVFTAECIYKQFSEEYGDVCYVGIDLDKHGYPKGCARVTFVNPISYIGAILFNRIMIRHKNTVKILKVKAFMLANQPCHECLKERVETPNVPYYCPDYFCRQYFCITCFNKVHQDPLNQHHLPYVMDVHS